MRSHLCDVEEIWQVGPSGMATALVLYFVLVTAAIAGAQQRLDWSADDGKRIESLEKGGSRIDGTHVILRFPPSLSRSDAEALVKRLDPAVEGLWRRVGVHDWQAVPKGKITYYLHDDAFVSHASGRSAVFVSMARVKDGRAPFLHEATHELLSSTRRAPAPTDGTTPVVRPLWLTEGLADYIARLVADQLGISRRGSLRHAQSVKYRRRVRGARSNAGWRDDAAVRRCECPTRRAVHDRAGKVCAYVLLLFVLIYEASGRARWARNNH